MYKNLYICFQNESAEPHNDKKMKIHSCIKEV
jgi:hypothetical protein